MTGEKILIVKRIKLTLLVILFFVAAVPIAAVTIFYIIPASAIEGFIVRTLTERAGVIAKTQGIEKVFPLGIRSGGLIIKDAASGNVLLSIDGVWAGLDPLRLSAGKVAVDYKASLSGGLAEGTVAAGLSGTSININLKRVSIFTMPGLERLMLASALPFDGTVSLALPKRGCLTGEIALSGRSQGGSELSYGGLPLPFGKVRSAVMEASFQGPSSEGEGADSVDGTCVFAIKKISVKCNELEAEVKGDIFFRDSLDESRVNMYLEIRPEKSLLEKEFLLSLIKAHRRNDGSYRIMFKGSFKEAFAR